MPFAKGSSGGLLLFEDDGTPIKWTTHHGDAWHCGHNDAEIDLPCPFPAGSAYALCWEAGFSVCKETGNCTPSGRKRKQTVADFVVQKDGVSCAVIGNARDCQKLQERTGLSLLPSAPGLHAIHADSVEVLLEALLGLS